ncbi:hypothetical protein Kpol_298p4 [Vanderwaltozyma polyspora DSM 70294]|uniref:Alpha-1,3-mannosyltransferase MNT3 n=1 Tax=Vanderwaltozyma polyspora (strain ATCC 22028 / DSM 70294 / BCRC 21397 / CBS 2163 / NBRC 10782 / NRRL Y-8283 / UCD 57-17) TaxID=436907 RepID=A7TT57_VANPO|nr:uncharacterized protein Kpol_298p4 [Vanderwaltozyma polyspora DSM 70294]EDO14552.1 hypothetical protein Kpol_298p4 [Vanderwaltozyma polyspora DSM 70294]
MAHLLTSRFRTILLKRLGLIILLVVFLKLIHFPFLESNGGEVVERANVAFREAYSLSTFHVINKLQKNSQEPHSKNILFPKLANKFPEDMTNVIENWEAEETSKEQKCRTMIELMYLITPTWTNDEITKFHNIDELDNLIISLMGERLRIYDYCFMSGNLDIKNVLDAKRLSLDTPIDISDFQHRMFPFLKEIRAETEYFWPTITNLRTNTTVPIPNFEQPQMDFNLNFWKNWSKAASGKGIVITMGERDKPMLFKLLRVLEFQDNKYPIQIVTSGNELSREFINEIHDELQRIKQDVYLVDCGSLLDPHYSKDLIINFLNKWLAVIFNTFEEVIFLDVDVIPFVDMDYFFDNEEYKSSNLLLYKDRVMLHESTYPHCIDMFHEVEPSREESAVLGTKILFDSRTKEFDHNSQVAMTFRNFFRKLQLHHVDSGLIVVNKMEKLNGLLFSFMLHLDAKVRRCVYGDKELFWIGQLFAGQTYSIDKIDSGLIGPVIEGVDEKTNMKKFQICATQMSHSDANGDLVWTNGGLKTCKINDAAKSDFLNTPDYFTDRYETEEVLRRIYESPLMIEGLIIPDVKVESWLQIRECANYFYCASALFSETDTSNNVGQFKKFDEQEKAKFNKISELWNS